MAETTPSLSIEYVQHLLNKKFQSYIAERGKRYHEEGKVINFSVQSNNRIEAQVDGTHLYHVTVVLDDFGLSNCTCPYEDYCKHMAAVLYEWQHRQVLANIWDKNIPQPVIDTLHPVLFSTYRQLISRAYLTVAQVEELMEAMKTAVKQHFSDAEAAVIYIYIIQAMYGMATSYQTYERQERRFSSFFQGLQEFIIQALPALSDGDLLRLAKAMFRSFLSNENTEYGPWESLMREFLPLVPSRLYQRLSDLLDATYEKQPLGKKGRLVKSYFLLAEGHGLLALQQLEGHTIREPDVLPHMTWMKTNHAWTTMKAWFHMLFPRKESAFLYLQPFYDEMEVETASDESLQSSNVWARWLQQPSYQRLLSLTKNWSKEKRSALIQELLPALKNQLEQMPSRIAYIKLLTLEKRAEEGANYLLQYETEPFRLRPEVNELLQMIQCENRELLFPVYHQFVLRLIEKKSRPHYEEAVHFLKILHCLYKETEDKERFHQYIRRLKYTYKSYRALLEELRQLDS
ncbi:SWIM zinc finger family protein [Halalkalibacterium halodurans]|uniref:SWIM zinc finger family protein n=1 Tax=Halalkalibacterium halodurans TaxID=86665 RepID=UPI002E237C6A|nr:SWIM zinc finger family protein [Halalkalibacterium halodurans]MED3645341.1 SWIM zinc finger family protein [Halalkalibacterium halodurans]